MGVRFPTGNQISAREARLKLPFFLGLSALSTALVGFAPKPSSDIPNYVELGSPAAEITITGAPPRVDRSLLRIAGVHKDALQATSQIPNLNFITATPGAKTIDFVSRDRYDVDVEALRSGGGILTAHALRRFPVNGSIIELFKRGLTMVVAGYGQFDVMNQRGEVVIGVNVPPVEDRNALIIFRGDTTGRNGVDTNLYVRATDHNRAYTTGIVLASDQQHVSERQVNDMARISLGGIAPNGLGCGGTDGCTREYDVVGIESTAKAYGIAAKTSMTPEWQWEPGKTNVV